MEVLCTSLAREAQIGRLELLQPKDVVDRGHHVDVTAREHHSMYARELQYCHNTESYSGCLCVLSPPFDQE